jgi:hypothetical protein
LSLDEVDVFYKVAVAGEHFVGRKQYFHRWKEKLSAYLSERQLFGFVVSECSS